MFQRYQNSYTCMAVHVYQNVWIYLCLLPNWHLSIVIWVCMRINNKSIINYQKTETLSRLVYKRHTVNFGPIKKQECTPRAIVHHNNNLYCDDAKFHSFSFSNLHVIYYSYEICPPFLFDWATRTSSFGVPMLPIIISS